MLEEYTGNCEVKLTTFSLTDLILASLSISSRTSQIKLPNNLVSFSLKPLVVIAAVPSLIPDVTNGLCGSFGTEFLLTVMFAL